MRSARVSIERMIIHEVFGSSCVPKLLRRLRTGVTSETVNILLPGAIYGDRVNNIDMRIAKVLRFGGTRANVGVDFYNLTNANTGTTFEASYDPATNGTRWMRPTAVLQPRFVRFNVQFDF